uniref:Uncharacterized protein n=1 Tax=Panagrolaimus sp. ES5 TaxID=591445 RepID=A0AC34FKJ3_9BILA
MCYSFVFLGRSLRPRKLPLDVVNTNLSAFEHMDYYRILMANETTDVKRLFISEQQIDRIFNFFQIYSPRHVQYVSSSDVNGFCLEWFIDIVLLPVIREDGNVLLAVFDLVNGLEYNFFTCYSKKYHVVGRLKRRMELYGISFKKDERRRNDFKLVNQRVHQYDDGIMVLRVGEEIFFTGKFGILEPFNPDDERRRYQLIFDLLNGQAQQWIFPATLQGVNRNIIVAQPEDENNSGTMLTTTSDPIVQSTNSNNIIDARLSFAPISVISNNDDSGNVSSVEHARITTKEHSNFMGSFRDFDSVRGFSQHLSSVPVVDEEMEDDVEEMADDVEEMEDDVEEMEDDVEEMEDGDGEMADDVEEMEDDVEGNGETETLPNESTITGELELSMARLLSTDKQDVFDERNSSQYSQPKLDDVHGNKVNQFESFTAKELTKDTDASEPSPSSPPPVNRVKDFEESIFGVNLHGSSPNFILSPVYPTRMNPFKASTPKLHDGFSSSEQYSTNDIFSTIARPQMKQNDETENSESIQNCTSDMFERLTPSTNLLSRQSGQQSFIHETGEDSINSDAQELLNGKKRGVKNDEMNNGEEKSSEIIQPSTTSSKSRDSVLVTNTKPRLSPRNDLNDTIFYPTERIVHRK